MARRAVGSRKNINIILLNGHNIKSTHKIIEYSSLKCPSQPLSKKLMFVVYDDHHRDL